MSYIGQEEDEWNAAQEKKRRKEKRKRKKLRNLQEVEILRQRVDELESVILEIQNRIDT